MAGHPIRKEELAVLESMGRGLGSRAAVDDAILLRLAQLGLVEQQRGVWSLTARGTMDLSRRKALDRGKHKR